MATTDCQYCNVPVPPGGGCNQAQAGECQNRLGNSIDREAPLDGRSEIDDED